MLLFSATFNQQGDVWHNQKPSTINKLSVRHWWCWLISLLVASSALFGQVLGCLTNVQRGATFVINAAMFDRAYKHSTNSVVTSIMQGIFNNQ